MSRRTILAGIAACFVLGATARAQDRCPSCMDSVTGQWHMFPAVGLRGGIPQKLSAAIGIAAGRNSDQSQTRDLVIYVEPGMSAGRATLGYHSGFGNMGSGVGIGATALRTWKGPLEPIGPFKSLATNETFVGGEIWVWPIFFLGPRVGAFRQVTGARSGWFFTADFGFGL